MVLKRLVLPSVVSEKEVASGEEGSAAGAEVADDGGQAPVLKELLKK